MKEFVTGIVWSIGLALPLIWLAGLLFNFAGREWYSVSLGGSLALIYVAAGFISFYIALSKKHKAFSRVVITSITARLVLIAVAIVLVFKFADVNEAVFLITLFVFYFVFQIWEVISFNKLVIKGS